MGNPLRSITRNEVVRLSAVACLTLFALAYMGKHRSAEANLRPAPVAAERDKGAMHRDGCMVHGSTVKSPPCIYGQRGSDTRAVLFGDSHALQWGPAMHRISNRRGWRLAALLRGRCAIAHVRTSNRDCDRWRNNSIGRIRRMQPKMIVVAASTGTSHRAVQNGRTLSRSESQPHLRNGMGKILRAFLNTGARVFLIRDQGLAPFRPNDCLRDTNSNRPNQACGFVPIRPGNQAFTAQASSKMARVRMIDPHPKLCPRLQRCPAVDGNIVIYRDRYHLTATYVRSIAAWLGGRLPGRL